MFSWIARALLILAGIVASWFWAKDALNFGVIQMIVAVLLFMLVIFVLAFWPPSWTAKLNRLLRRRPPTLR